jgi:nucleotide-binding universal stress UspA family protein
MAIRTVHFSLLATEDARFEGACAYAVDLTAREGAHLSVWIGAPVLSVPSVSALPLVRAVVDQFNAERLSAAEKWRAHLEMRSRLAGIVVECHIEQRPFPALRRQFVEAARLSDMVVLPRPHSLLDLEKPLVQGMLFETGRPVLVVPVDFPAAPELRRVVIAWDGGARAARALGDAMPFIERAGHVEVVCISRDAETELHGADIADHLARHTTKVTLNDLPLLYADAGRTLAEHLATVQPDLLVMGAYAHARLLQLVLGGVTSTMLETATVPVLYSY